MFSFVDQSNRSFVETIRRNRDRVARRHGFGRRALAQARSSAIFARYFLAPPLRAISRLTVDGARPIARAMTRSDEPAAKPREISSRSSQLKAACERLRGSGAIPP